MFFNFFCAPQDTAGNARSGAARILTLCIAKANLFIHVMAQLQGHNRRFTHFNIKMNG
jgi:hypothetical protein